VPCCFCGRELHFNEATMEHVVPRSLGGPTIVENLKISCARCSNERGVEDFEAFLERKAQSHA
jgi:5-methylcytosine-specific restriction endonuclease McrA